MPLRPESTGDSPTAQAFGAKIDVAAGSWAMCLVVAHRSPQIAVNSVGGRILAALSPTRAIAVVDMTRFAQLKRHPDVVSAGSVSVDPQRFARFQQIVGLPG